MWSITATCIKLTNIKLDGYNFTVTFDLLKKVKWVLCKVALKQLSTFLVLPNLKKLPKNVNDETNITTSSRVPYAKQWHIMINS